MHGEVFLKERTSELSHSQLGLQRRGRDIIPGGTSTKAGGVRKHGKAYLTKH